MAFTVELFKSILAKQALDENVQKALTDDVYSALVEGCKEELKGNFVPLSRFNEVNAAKKTLQSEKEALQDQLTKQSDNQYDAEKQFAKMKADFQAEMQAFKKDDFLKETLSKLPKSPKDFNLVKDILASKVEVLEDGSFKDLSETVDKLVKEKDFLFEQKSPSGWQGFGNDSSDNRSNVQIATEKAVEFATKLAKGE